MDLEREVSLAEEMAKFARAVLELDLGIPSQVRPTVVTITDGNGGGYLRNIIGVSAGEVRFS